MGVCSECGLPVVQKIVCSGHDAAYRLGVLQPPCHRFVEMVGTHTDTLTACKQEHLIGDSAGCFRDFQPVAFDLAPDEGLVVVYPGCHRIRWREPSNSVVHVLPPRRLRALEKQRAMAVFLTIASRGDTGESAAHDNDVVNRQRGDRMTLSMRPQPWDARPASTQPNSMPARETFDASCSASPLP